MSIRSEIDYCVQREREERSRAESCSDIAARRVHLDMARRYHDRAQTNPMPATEQIGA